MVSPILGDHWSGTQNAGTKAAPRTKRRGKARRVTRGRHLQVRLAHVEMLVLAAIVALVLIYAGSAIGQRFFRPAETPVIAVKVGPGDTLWTLAERYGHPSDYILKRVDHLAEANGIAPGAQLQPGQVLSVPVENPEELNRLVASGSQTLP